MGFSIGDLADPENYYNNASKIANTADSLISVRGRPAYGEAFREARRLGLLADWPGPTDLALFEQRINSSALPSSNS